MLDIVITNRLLCKGNFLDAIEKALIHKPFAVILREKDLPRDKYIALTKDVNRLCEAHGVPLITHSLAVPGIPRLHMPFHMATEQLAREFQLSLSIHSVEEARTAEALGASFVIAGHVFATQCKPGLPPRGINFLREVCESVAIPVFAIGGITGDHAQACIDAGAAGVCRMSYWMEA
jgi:thiamine-phosphate pyrophosphorylase